VRAGKPPAFQPGKPAAMPPPGGYPGTGSFAVPPRPPALGPQGFTKPGTGPIPVPIAPGGFPAATGTVPAILPPLPGMGKVVPAPPPLPGVPAMAPLPISSGSPLVAPGAPLGTSSVRILSDFVRYDRQTKQALARGNTKIYQEDVVISTTEAQYDQQNKITNIRVPFDLVQMKPDEPRTTLKGQAMTAYHNSKHVVVERDVQLVRAGKPEAKPANTSKKEKLKTAFKKEDTVINADHMDYWTNTKDAKFDGNVRFIQKEKNATAAHAFVDNRIKKIFMNDNVVLTQIKGDWLVREGLVDTSKPDTDRDEALKERTVMTGDKLEVDQDTNDAIMTGALVTVTQKGKRATGKRAEYSDREQKITLTQDVRIAKDDGGFLTADRAVFHTESDKFEAFGAQGMQVETEFKLDDEKKPGT
jgi:lipopolysaccharide assembly outer membrane protein LptD (OstA)